MFNGRLTHAANILDKGLGTGERLLELSVTGHQDGVGGGEQGTIHPRRHQHNAGTGHDAVGVEGTDGVLQDGVGIIVVCLVAVPGDRHEKEQGIEEIQDVLGLLLLVQGELDDLPHPDLLVALVLIKGFQIF